MFSLIFISFNSAWFNVSFSSSENDTHAVMNDVVYIEYRSYHTYENCRRPGVAILDMQMSKVPIISGYVPLVEQKLCIIPKHPCSPSVVMDSSCSILRFYIPRNENVGGILVSPCSPVCRQILCRTITWVVFLRIFQYFISCLLVKTGGSLSFLTIFTFAVPELLDLIWRKIGLLPYVVW